MSRDKGANEKEKNDHAQTTDDGDGWNAAHGRGGMGGENNDAQRRTDGFKVTE